MIENVNADMNVLRCPVCSAPLTVKGEHSDVAYCGYCSREYIFEQNADGSIVYHDKKGYHSARKKKIAGHFVVVAATIGIIAVIGIAVGKSGGKQSEVSKVHQKNMDKINTNTYEWPDNELGKTVPEAVFENGWMYSNSSENFMVDIGNVSKEEFEEYEKECINAGFNVNSDNSGNYLHAFNEEGYELQVSYAPGDKKMSVYAAAPKTLNEYEWPDKGLATLLPKPEFQYGVVLAGTDKVEAEIYQVSPKKFEDYVDDCIKTGFNNNYDKSISTGYFIGYDDNGYELYISYEENDYYQTMRIVLE